MRLEEVIEWMAEPDQSIYRKSSRVWKSYEDINMIQDSCFWVELVKIRRESNKEAHMLAERATRKLI
jgi:hypothetical protein